MDIDTRNLLDDNPDCVLNAECIKLSGRSDVFNAKSVRFDQNGQILVSRKAVKPGTNLIVRFKDLSHSQMTINNEDFRATSLTEVQWVEELIDADGLAYAFGVNYIYND